MPRRSPGFNGAAARWPRRLASAAAYLCTPAGLQWGRGSVAAETGRRAGRTAAPATCFNGAAARWPRRLNVWSAVPPVRVTLQWGRGSVAAETTPGRVNVIEISEQASMGPRLGGRGDHVQLAAAAVGDVARFNGAAARWPRRQNCYREVHHEPARASMGPRLGGRGDRSAGSSRRLHDHGLQWGRGSVAAET